MTGKGHRTAAAASAAVLLFFCAAAAQPGRANNPYDELDPAKLGQALSAMGMNELLEAYIAELRSAGRKDAAKDIELEYLISRAMAATGLQQRDGLLDEAIKILEGMVAEAEKKLDAAEEKNTPKGPGDYLTFYRQELTLAETLGLTRAQPYVQRVMYLQGSELDRKIIGDLTGRAVKILDKLTQQLDDSMQAWREDRRIMVIYLPQAEEFEKLMKYKAAWIRFHRGMALTEGDEKRLRLRDAIDAVRKYADGDAGSGVKYWSLLLCGMTARELAASAKNEREKASWHQQASDFLQGAGDGHAEQQVQVQAKFETARNLVEQKNFKQALKTIADFRKLCAALLRTSKLGGLQADVRTAMLESFLYERWAQVKPSEKQKYEALAQRALLQFIEKHSESPDVVSDFFRIIATKFRGRTDYDKLNSVVLLSLAVGHLSHGGGQSLAEAEGLLARIAGRKDAVTEQVRPLAIWNMAVLYNQRKDNRKAAKTFIELAEKHPKHRLAKISALNAAASYDGIFRERTGPVDLTLRVDFVQALDLLLREWPKDSQAVRWHIERGAQCEKIVGMTAKAEKAKWMGKAIAAYEMTPAEVGVMQHLDARYRALELRFRRLVERADSPARRTAASQLQKMLGAFSSEAGQAARNQQDETAAADLRNWAARADFRRAEIFHEVLGNSAQALAEVRVLARKWPRSDVLRFSLELGIRILLADEKRTGQAISRMEEYRKKYPDQAQGLMHQVVLQIRKRIDALSDDASKRPALEKYRKSYLLFAREVYKTRKAKNLPFEQMRDSMKLLAHARLESDLTDQALALYRQLRAHEKRIKDELARKVDAQVKDVFESIDSAKNDPVRVKGQAEKYERTLKEEGFITSDLPALIDLKETIKRLDESKTADQQKRELEFVVRALRIAYKELFRNIRRSAPVDPEALGGEARCLAKLKQYDKAISLYNTLVVLVSSDRLPKLYWSAQLELSRCLLNFNRNDPKALRRLQGRILQLQRRDKATGGQMGGLYPKFNAIREEARSLANPR